ncbi:DUF2911 domain-containing protein [Larkinella arboricola]|uniref:DUF2911 family protein n=1 Tax=Larkinella arboricola TaxID=643671 RepID=A0A327X724_LARAB|nr:DUF2911 domain-containing protein [Larkinella arboricola]RAK02008.1 Protein of unknown function (DUF2911) [Larkinella arboricola]
MKKVLWIIGALAVLVLVAFWGIRSYTKSASPEATAEINQNGVYVKVEYCQPYKKGRKIFGGIVPYGQVWRTGANEATIITLDQNVTVAGQPLDEGEYSLWTIPSEGNWIVIFNRETGQWGTDYDQTKDVLRVPVLARKRNAVAEQFYISFAPQSGGTDMMLVWDNTEAVVPIRVRENQ